jgi:hypothetical protein
MTAVFDGMGCATRLARYAAVSENFVLVAAIA